MTALSSHGVPTTVKPADTAEEKVPPAVETDTALPPTQQSALPSRSEMQSEATESAESHTRKPFDKDAVLPVFRSDLNEIISLGSSLKTEQDEQNEKLRDKVIKAFAKILEVRRKYFDDATPEAIVTLMEDLRQQCRPYGLKGRNSRTTEFHLLSRLLRRSDTKQASADAKILIRAHIEGQTAQTFATWVKAADGLNKIRRQIEVDERAAKQAAKATRVPNKAKSVKRVIDAVVASHNAGAWSTAAILPADALPGVMRTLIPPSGWRPIVIKQHDNELHFYVLPEEEALKVKA